MNTGGTKKKLTGFRKIFLIYAVALALLLLIGLAVLWFVLADYQSQRDAAQLAVQVERAPQEAFETFFERAEPEYWAQEWLAAHPESYDEPENVEAALSRLFSGKDVACWKAESATAENPAYIVKDGDTPLALVMMQGGGLDWQVDTVTLYPEGTFSGTVTVPTDCAVFCNGKLLAQSGAQRAAAIYDMDAVKQELHTPVEWVTYSVAGQLSEPVFTVEPPEGRTLALVGERYVYVLDDDHAAPYRQQGDTFARALARYYLYGSRNTEGNLYYALSFVQRDSQAFRLISAALDGITWISPCPLFTCETSTDYVVALADNVLALDVSFKTLCEYAPYRNTDGVYRIYFVDGGDGFEICNLFLL